MPRGLTADGRWLAVGRPNGQCEIWDLATLQRTAVLGDAVTPSISPQQDIESPEAALHGAEQVRWFADANHLAVYRDNQWQIFDLHGKRTPLQGQRDYSWVNAASPVGLRLALAYRNVTSVYDAATGKKLWQWDVPHWNSGQQRLAWTPNARYLLLNDSAGVHVWDVRRGEAAFFHRELDLRLPPPMIADDRSGICSPEATSIAVPLPEVAALVDSQFSPDGSCVATLYHTLDMMGVTGDPDVNRVRFYATTTGAILWDEILPMAPRAMAFSPDGKRLYVLMDHADIRLLRVYDTATRKPVAELSNDLRHLWLKSIAPLPDNRWIASLGSQLWLVDTREQCAPLHLPGSPNPAEVHISPDGTRLIEVGIDRTVRVWQQRRPISPLGAFALPETWALYAAALALVLGTVLIAGRAETRDRRHPLPTALWIAALILALCVAWSIADIVVGYAVDGLYQWPPDPPGFWSLLFQWGLAALFFAALLGLIRTRPRWWWFQIIALTVSAIVLALLAALGLWVLSRVPLHSLPLTLHGWRYATAPWAVPLLLLFALLWTLAPGVLLLRSEVRAAFRPRPQGPGFPVLQ